MSNSGKVWNIREAYKKQRANQWIEPGNIGLYAGDSRVEASDLIIQNLNIFHRSTNKMIVNPQQSIIGEIRSLGDVISKNIPPVVEVTEYYTGTLIFD